MQSTEYIIQLARERAFFSFSSLLTPVVMDAETSISGAASTARNLDQQKSLWLAEKFLKQDAALFCKRFESVFHDYLDRAMQTMYRDLRMRLGQISADDLTLIDDQTVNRELEVDRLLLRLRDANDENLSRINIIIAQLHGHKEVKERENPFRPYLIARSLHQVLLELVPDEAVEKVLFEHLCNALATRLSDYYDAIRTVFESRGIRAKLLTQPGRLVKHQRYAGGSFLDGDDQLRDNSPAEVGFKRIMEVLPSADAKQAAEPVDRPSEAAASAQELQDFVRKIFARSKELDWQPGTGLAMGWAPQQLVSDTVIAPALRPASADLLSRVEQFQRDVAQGVDAGAQALPKQFELFDANRADDHAGKMERITIDVVGMLFQYLLEDDQIPKEVREQIGRLQIPFLKAAMMAPDVLQQAEHPARKLLNRMSSIAIGIDPETPEGMRLTDEMKRIVDKVLHEFKDDPAVFSVCLEELEAALARQLAVSDRNIAQSVERIKDAQHASEQLCATVVSLQKFLQPLIVDARAFRFVCEIWARVLCREAFARESSDAPRFRDLVPDLLWSIQEKRDPDERNALIRILPDLVKQLKEGMLSIELPEAECQEALDHFVALHMEVLRASKSAPFRKLFTREQLRHYFSGFIAGHDCVPPTLVEDASAESIELDADVVPPPQDRASAIDALELQATTLESALAEHGIASDLDSGTKPMPAFESDEEWMAQMQLGVSVERWSDGMFQFANLAWISRNRTLFLFRDKQTDRPFVFSAPSLLKALREGSVRMVEYAPAFERAVDALLLDAGALQNQFADKDS